MNGLIGARHSHISKGNPKMRRKVVIWKTMASAALLVMAQAVAAEESALRKVAYDVADLVLPIPRLYLGVPPSAETAPRQADNRADFDPLIDLIVTMVKPTTWDDVGGPGSISFSKADLRLVVKQTQEVHEEIASLLDQLRRLNDLDIGIRLTFLSVPDEAMPAALKGRETANGVVLRSQQANQLVVEAKQQHSANLVRQRITVQNGQLAIIATSAGKGDTQATVLEIEAVVSWNGRFIRLAVYAAGAANKGQAAGHISDRTSLVIRREINSVLPTRPASEILDTVFVPIGETLLCELPEVVSRRQQGNPGNLQAKTPRIRRFVLIAPRLVTEDNGQRQRDVGAHPISLPPPAVPSM
jgi:hypothetical protein